MSNRRASLQVACISTLIAAAALLLAKGCSRAEPHSDTKPASTPPLRIAMDLWPGYYPLILAKELGLDAKHQFQADITFPQDTHRMIADFAAGKYDGVCVALGDLIMAFQKDQEMRLILCSDQSAGADQIIGDARLNEAGALRGRRISTNLGGFGELLVRRYVISRGFSPKDVSVVNADAAAALDLLEAKQVDAAHTWEPYASQARASGHALLYSSADAPGLILDGLVVHRELVRVDGERLRRLIAAWFEALEWWSNHGDEGNRKLEAALTRMGLPPVPVSLEGIRVHDRNANQRLFKDGGAGGLRASADEYIDFFVERGSLPAKVSSASLIDGSLLP